MKDCWSGGEDKNAMTLVGGDRYFDFLGRFLFAAALAGAIESQQQRSAEVYAGQEDWVLLGRTQACQVRDMSKGIEA